MGGVHRIEWPDGKALIEQPAIVVAMFELMHGEATAALAEASKRGG